MFQTNLLKGKHILLGITGGIAAYKTTELVRFLIKNGAEVQVVMTEAAKKFITQLTLETLSQKPVLTSIFPEEEFSATHHIRAADWADAAIIAPATFNFIGKMAAGIADDLLTTIVAALHCPVVVAPAMNVNMWNNPVLKGNLEKLKDFGVLICPPEEGFLAEGYSGMGRLAPLHHLVQYLYRAIHPEKDSLKGKKVLVTAGRTEENIDPVRLITNRSSGKMGYALAWEAFARGAEVTLIHGPSNLPDPVDIQRTKIQTAEEMFEAVQTQIDTCDIYISAAAIADYTPALPSQHKIKKRDSDLSIKLKRTTDILQFVSEKKRNDQILIGFAVETDSPEENALKKLHSKKLDVVVLNNPLEKGAAFDSDTNAVKLFSKKNKKKEIPVLPKLDVAREIMDFVQKNI